MPLGAEERRLLLRIARDALSVAASASSAVSARLDVARIVPHPAALPPVLREPAGVFVSLHKQEELRGCVGLVEARLPLYEAVIDAAASAALRDPRFPPVDAAELPEIEVEISVLSPPRLLEPVTPSKIQVGVHGVMVTQGSSRGLLLPQVAAERNWSPQRFLEETCRKAGLATDAWQSGARVEVFEADVFGESTASGHGREQNS